MNHIIDLDALSVRLAVSMERWRQRAAVGPTTWRDELSSWPHPIVEDRSSVRVAESLGIHVETSDGEIHVVVWTGGWADIAGMTAEVEIVAAPEFANTNEAHDVVVQVIDDFLGREKH
ncbi:hypothetical protein [Herbiconiux ginsengi]|nr:hypothetical protein [Herbiconiux ginsengi]